jgi:DNA replication factor GINS
MRYSDLYRVWKRERESSALQELPEDFYSKLGSYVKSLLEKEKELDVKSLRRQILSVEIARVGYMITSLIHLRFKKISERQASERIHVKEEVSFCKRLLSVIEERDKLIKEILAGRFSERKYVLIRFLQSVPSVMGSDMRVYGPFKAEDVAFIPVEDAKAFLERRLAVLVKS